MVERSPCAERLWMLMAAVLSTTVAMFNVMHESAC